FLLRTRVGYPSAAEERRLLIEPDRRDLLMGVQPVLDPGRVVQLIELAGAVHVSEPVLDYIQALRSEEHTSELQSRFDLVCRLLRPPPIALLPYTTLFRSASCCAPASVTPRQPKKGDY